MSYTQNDLNAFYAIPADLKAKILCGYLGMRGYNMTDVANKILHDNSPQSGQRVSVVTRVYGFSGQNSGRFSRLYDPIKNRPDYLQTMLSDFAAFVGKYPNGETDPATMEAFLKARISSRAKPQQQAPRPTYNPQPKQTYSQPRQQYVQPQQSYTPPSQAPSGGSGGGNNFDTDKLKTIGVRVLVVVIIIAAVFVFGSKKKTGCAGITCGSTTCVTGKQVNALLDIGCYTDDTIDYVNIVVDDMYYSPLNIGVNKFRTELGKGKHTVHAEYQRNGAVYKTESLTFKLKKDNDLVDLLIYLNGEELVLTFSDDS